MRYFLVFQLILVSAFNLYAAEIPMPKVEFSADTRIEADGMVVSGKLYQAKKKQRMEMNASGTETVMIVRMDKDVSWMLMPDQKMFLQMSLDESRKKSNDVTGCSVEKKAKGSETVNAVKTSRYSVKMSCPEEVGYAGTFWISKDDILVKMELSKTGENGASRLVSELRNIKTGKQPASLFEVPAGYQPVNMGGIFNSIGAAMKSSQEQQEKMERERIAREAKKARSSANSGRDYTSTNNQGRDYTSRAVSSGRDYTSSQTEGRDYSARPKGSSGSGGVLDTLDKVKGLFNW